MSTTGGVPPPISDMRRRSGRSRDSAVLKHDRSNHSFSGTSNCEVLVAPLARALESITSSGLRTKEDEHGWIRTLRRSPVRWLGLLVVAAVMLIAPLGSSPALAAGSRVGFGFHAVDISGFPTGSVSLKGGGAFNLSAAAGPSRGRRLQLYP